MANAEHSCLLKLSNSKDLIKFLHRCVDDLVGKTDENFDMRHKDIEWKLGEYKKARNLIQNVYKENVFNEEEFKVNLSNLNINDIQQIRECFEMRKEEITQAVLRQKLLENDIPLVENIDWKIKWVIGSSKLASINEPLLQCDLHSLNNLNERKLVNFEINLEQLDDVIKKLESIKADLL